MLDRNGKEIKAGQRVKFGMGRNLPHLGKVVSISPSQTRANQEFASIKKDFDPVLWAMYSKEVEIIENSAVASAMVASNVEAPCHTCKRKNYLDAKNCWCCGSTRVFHLGASYQA